MQDGEHRIVRSDAHEEHSQEVIIFMRRILGVPDASYYTKEQVDELLSQKRQIAGYIHDRQRSESYDNKFYVVIVLAFIFGFSALILWRRPDYFPELLSFLAGLFGGGLGGYGLARIKN